MNFLFWLENHTELGQRSLEDVIGIFGKQLRELGHKAVWDITKRETMYHHSDGYNILVEGFTEPVVNMIAEMHAKGARFLILATEEPTPKGFNHGTQPEMVKRQKVFPQAAKYCDGIIHLVPGQHVTDWYGQFAPTAYCELGYAKSLVRPFYDIQPDYDFGFYGSMSQRRYKLLKRLANRTGKQKAIRVMGDFKTQRERDDSMKRAKVILQIRKFKEMGLVSSSRCNTALCIGRPVVAEPHLLSKPWDEIVTFTDSEEHFINQAIITAAAWKGVHAAQMERFKTKLSPELCAGAALEKLGILNREAGGERGSIAPGTITDDMKVSTTFESSEAESQAA